MPNYLRREKASRAVRNEQVPGTEQLLDVSSDAGGPSTSTPNLPRQRFRDGAATKHAHPARRSGSDVVRMDHGLPRCASAEFPWRPCAGAAGRCTPSGHDGYRTLTIKRTSVRSTGMRAPKTRAVWIGALVGVGALLGGIGLSGGGLALAS